MRHSDCESQKQRKNQRNSHSIANQDNSYCFQEVVGEYLENMNSSKSTTLILLKQFPLVLTKDSNKHLTVHLSRDISIVKRKMIIAKIAHSSRTKRSFSSLPRISTFQRENSGRAVGVRVKPFWTQISDYFDAAVAHWKSWFFRTTHNLWITVFEDAVLCGLPANLTLENKPVEASVSFISFIHNRTTSDLICRTWKKRVPGVALNEI